METHKTKLCIIGTGPAAHTAAIYAARAELSPLLISPGSQLTSTTTDVDIVENLRKQSERFGTKIFTESVHKVDFSSKPFKLFTDSRTVIADAVIIFSTGSGGGFLDGQIELDEDGNVVTKLGTTETSVAGVFAAGGDVQEEDNNYRQAITAALDAEHYLQKPPDETLAQVSIEILNKSPTAPKISEPARDSFVIEFEKEAAPLKSIKQTRCKWSPAEDVVLITAWLNTTKDPIMGSEQKAYWKRIAAYYSSSPAVVSLPKRESRHCKQRWHKLNDGVCKFVGCYDQALSQRTIGQSEDDVVQVAYRFYFDRYKCKFTVEHAWRKLRHDQKWCTSQNAKSSASSKRTKLGEGGAFSSSSNTESNVEEQQAIARTIGVKMSSKRKGKEVVTITTRNEERESNSLSRHENLLALKEKDIAERNKLSRMELLRCLLEKTKQLSEKEETLKNKLIDEML